MEKVQAYISLGSNCEHAEIKLQQALFKLSKFPFLEISTTSPVFQTEPQDYKQQAWFLNQCVKVKLEEFWTAESFLGELLKLEYSLGRERDKKIRFGPRNIDLDLLIFGNIKKANTFCELPHPRMHRRAFVLLPLYLIEPQLLLYGRNLLFWLSGIKWKVSGNKIWQD